MTTRQPRPSSRLPIAKRSARCSTANSSATSRASPSSASTTTRTGARPANAGNASAMRCAARAHRCRLRSRRASACADAMRDEVAGAAVPARRARRWRPIPLGQRRHGGVRRGRRVLPRAHADRRPTARTMRRRRKWPRRRRNTHPRSRRSPTRRRSRAPPRPRSPPPRSVADARRAAHRAMCSATAPPPIASCRTAVSARAVPANAGRADHRRSAANRCRRVNTNLRPMSPMCRRARRAARVAAAGTLQSDTTRPWPRAVLPQLDGSGALVGRITRRRPSFYPFVPRRPGAGSRRTTHRTRGTPHGPAAALRSSTIPLLRSPVIEAPPPMRHSCVR